MSVIKHVFDQCASCWVTSSAGVVCSTGTGSSLATTRCWSHVFRSLEETHRGHRSQRRPTPTQNRETKVPAFTSISIPCGFAITVVAHSHQSHSHLTEACSCHDHDLILLSRRRTAEPRAAVERRPGAWVSPVNGRTRDFFYGSNRL